jgi:hypothetical protein
VNRLNLRGEVAVARFNPYKLALAALLALIFCLTVANLFIFYLLSLVLKVVEAL